jgi:thermitase
MKSFFRKAALLGLLLILIGIPSACKSDPAGHRPDEVLVKFKPDSSAEAVAAVRGEMGLEKIKEIPKLGVTLYRIKSRLTATELVERYKDNPHIEYIEPNYVYGLD